MAQSRSRKWVFTCNNYTADDVVTAKTWRHMAKYMVIGYETGEEKGTLHLQGAIYFHEQLRFSKVKKLHKGMHWETIYSDGKAAFDYCKKSGHYEEFGRFPNEKKKQKLDEVAAEVFNMNIADAVARLEEERPGMMLMHRSRIISNLVERLEPFVGFRNIIWLWGKPRCGKTRYAIDYMGAERCIYKNGFYKFRPGAEVVVIDEIEKCNMPLVEFLTITDVYEWWVDVKHGSAPWTPHTIIFTSICMPEECWPCEEIEQVTGRITECINVFKGWDDGLYE